MFSSPQPLLYKLSWINLHKDWILSWGMIRTFWCRTFFVKIININHYQSRKKQGTCKPIEQGICKPIKCCNKTREMDNCHFCFPKVTGHSNYLLHFKHTETVNQLHLCHQKRKALVWCCQTRRTLSSVNTSLETSHIVKPWSFLTWSSGLWSNHSYLA